MGVLAQKGAACGTTSLAMIIRFLVPGSVIDPEDIDAEIRRLPGMFSSPPDLIAYARKMGLSARQYNDSRISDVAELVAEGIPVMALLDLTPDNALDTDRWHWVVVVGVDGTPPETSLLINNPWGDREEWRSQSFSKEWAHLRLLGLAFGYSRYFIAVGTSGDTLPDRKAVGVGAANMVTKGLADILNGYARTRRNGRLAGAGQTICGGARLIVGGIRLLGFNLCLFLRIIGRPKSREAYSGG